MNNDLESVVALLIFLLVGVLVGFGSANQMWERKCLIVGVAEYRLIDKDTGEHQFCFITNTATTTIRKEK